MILGVFLRHIKVYKNINFIPLSDGKNFSGLLGDNGVGKSTVLEAFDTLFNDRDWNINIEYGGSKANSPYIVPIYFLPKRELDNRFSKDEVGLKFLSKMDQTFRDLQAEKMNSSVLAIGRKVLECRDRFLQENTNNTDYYIIPLGITNTRRETTAIFDSIYFNKDFYSNELHSDSKIGFSTEDNELSEEEKKNTFEKFLKELQEYIVKNLIEYIYIPKELSAEQFTKLHNQQFQSLMGSTLTETLEQHLTARDIKEINDKLDGIIDEIATDLGEYVYRTDSQRQQRLRKADIYNVIIDAYFKVRHIHLKRNSDYILIDKLSSGEKQKAIINIVHSLLGRQRKSNKNNCIIFGLDEPESSLHISACFDVFQKLYEISKSCAQLIFTTHWYGFLPSVIGGNTTVITKDGAKHNLDFVNISRYREETKQVSAKSTREEQYPFSIQLKSMNDLVQSIVCASMGDTPFNWLICEGSSEKIYFGHFFRDLVENKRLRILPVGSFKEVQKIYNHLSLPFCEFKSEITGKAFLLIDTDTNGISNNNILKDSQHPNLKFRRLALALRDTPSYLEKVGNNISSEVTEIEDVLHAKVFKKTLIFFVEEGVSEAKSILDVLSDKADSEDYYPAGWSIEKGGYEKQELMRNFFNLENGSMKLKFAYKYVELSQDYSIPWVDKIKGFYQR